MVETDWREILSFSQKELKQADKEKLCESLSWMEADDIELNFSDLKTLFRLAQDILKYKNEQVNNLYGRLETAQRKPGKAKGKADYAESPATSIESPMEMITHQEEMIKANKEILEQLFSDIAELESRKTELEQDGQPGGRGSGDRDSESSRDPLSELNAMAELENQLTMKNRHIRKLFGEVKVLEEDNTKLKEKVSVLKDKLNEATQLIENLTEQMMSITRENAQLKEILAKNEQTKAQLNVELEALRREFIEKDSSRDNIYDEMKLKVQHWKNVVKSKQAELDALTIENSKLKDDLTLNVQSSSSPKTKARQTEEIKIKELQEKLSEAADEIMESANLIDYLKTENKKLKGALDIAPEYSVSDIRNESDEGKERTIISKLQKKVKSLSIALQGAEEMLVDREKELTGVTSRLQLVKTDEGINALLEGLKSKKQQLKVKGETIKSLVQDVNTLNQTINDLQLENEIMRQKLNIPATVKISTEGIMKKYNYMERNLVKAEKELRKSENKLINREMENRDLKVKETKLCKTLREMGISKDKIDRIIESSDYDDDDDEQMPKDGGGEGSALQFKKINQQMEKKGENGKVRELMEENDGLRKGLQELLVFLKDNSTTSSGILALQCPTLESILHSMDARHSAGWYAPHMAAVMELKAAIGGKDALLSALHEARKETFDVMTKLSKESQKSIELERKLLEYETTKSQQDSAIDVPDTLEMSIGEFGPWVSGEDHINIDLSDRNNINNVIEKGNLMYDEQIKSSLVYFYKKFKELYDKMTTIEIQTAEDQKKWCILEEDYKSQIQNLKSRLNHNEEDDSSEVSPGLVTAIPTTTSLQRKCDYLNESYKQMRDKHDNIKNELLESKKDSITLISEYESKIQKLILSNAHLTDKLRNSISLDLFWKQNEALNATIAKYRKLNEDKLRKDATNDLLKRLENDKLDIIRDLHDDLMQDKISGSLKDKRNAKEILSEVEHSVTKKQLQQVCIELDEKNKEMLNLEEKLYVMQENQSKLIDTTLSSKTQEEIKLTEVQLERLVQDNAILKEQCQHVGSQLDIALLQLQDSQHRQMSFDMEMNILRHQILDLQSGGDNKAVIAKLSGEVLVAHLQASESYQKIERLNSALHKEKEHRAEVEEILSARQKIFDIYSTRFESKFRYLYEVMQVLRQQYQGSIPLTSIERYLNSVEDISRNTLEVNEKLDEIEEIRSNLMTKHSVFSQILDVSKNKCIDDEDSCPHKLQYLVTQGVHFRDIDHLKNKVETLEESRQELLKRYNCLEKTLVLVNQGFEKFPLSDVIDKRNPCENEIALKLEVEDMESDDESPKRSQTITLSKPQILKPSSNNIDMTNIRKNERECGFACSTPKTLKSSTVQTNIDEYKTHRSVQTELDNSKFMELKRQVDILTRNAECKTADLKEVLTTLQQKDEILLVMKSQKSKLESEIQLLHNSNREKEHLNENLRIFIRQLSNQIEESQNKNVLDQVTSRDPIFQENKSLKARIKQFENDINDTVDEYKELLRKERNGYLKSTQSLNTKIMQLQIELDNRKESESRAANADTAEDAVAKYSGEITKLENSYFRSQSELESCKAELKTYQSELERWKELASERLTKLEMLNSQLEERHCHEVESYKAENEQWLAKLNSAQRDHFDLRNKLTDQKTMYMKQLTEKDTHIEHMRNVIHGLKAQIVGMHTMVSVTDPSFDLSAIAEVDEAGGSELEIHFDSTTDLHDVHDDMLSKGQASSTAIWQEPIIERLRREKQLLSKQNGSLRRQIKALAARERRARLDAQNLKNQIFRISTSNTIRGSTGEVTALHSKIAMLQAQLTSCRRDSASTVALWDKCKRAQQSAERWQSKFEEKCHELKKMEASNSLARSSIARLEKEKRFLLSKLSEDEDQKERVFAIEKQDRESPEKFVVPAPGSPRRSPEPPPVPARALLDRVEAQQRRILALETAEKGNEHLVSAYEKALAEVTSLKGQVLKLESTLLETQIRSPISSGQDSCSELDYFKRYCEMLKEENVQLTMRAAALEPAPSVGSHRVNDLEQTVLTLRGLVSKLQAEQKCSGNLRKLESGPSSGRSISEKVRTQLECYRIEISNLKRTMQDKDLLLERSKEMLNIAAEREDELLRENATLHRQLSEVTRQNKGFLSA